MKPSASFIRGETSGRALFIDRTGRLYVARDYQIFRSEDGGATSAEIGAAGGRRRGSIASCFRLDSWST